VLVNAGLQYRNRIIIAKKQNIALKRRHSTTNIIITMSVSSFDVDL
jgi:hypothetical protein